jgi:hypothetical protein
MNLPSWVLDIIDNMDEATRIDYEERSGIIQYDAGYSRNESELMALLLILIRKYNLNIIRK